MKCVALPSRIHHHIMRYAHVTAADDKTPEGDAVTLALHPQFGIPGTEGLAQEWFLSDRVPGGGSGKFTL
ncbi:MAG: hypothetical protein IKH11_09280, partial [Bacteroidales bacterium]|nr:hypothetical protein [Bacteroidales bacterium]